MIDLLVAIPLPNGVDEKSTPAYKSAKKIGLPVAIFRGPNIDTNRNNLITRSILKKQTEFNFKKILFVDDDIGFEQSHIDMLLSHDKPVVSGLYYAHSQNQYCAGYWGVEKGIIGEPLQPNTGLIQCDWSGMGLMLIDSSVFRVMEYPYIRRYIVEHGDFCNQTFEDIGFCLHLQKNFVKLYVDTNCIPKHLKGVTRMEGQETRQELPKEVIYFEGMLQDVFIKYQKAIIENNNLKVLCSQQQKQIEELKKGKKDETTEKTDKKSEVQPTEEQ